KPAGRFRDVQLGKLRPGVVLVEPRRLDDGPVVLGLALGPNLGDAACDGVAEARAEQNTSIQALEGHRGPTPASRATGSESLTEGVKQGNHRRIPFYDRIGSAARADTVPSGRPVPAPAGSRPAVRSMSSEGPGDEPRDRPLTGSLPTCGQSPAC